MSTFSFSHHMIPLHSIASHAPNNVAYLNSHVLFLPGFCDRLCLIDSTNQPTIAKVIESQTIKNFGIKRRE